MVLLDPEAGRYYTLDAVGARCWELLAEHGEIEAVVAQLSDAGLVVPSGPGS